MIGIGNVVGIVTAVQLGGPGALLWVWVAGIIGSVIKYAEVFLGMKYRVEKGKGGYDGGPMYYLKAAFKSGFFPILAALLLCIYGVEIYQFSVITDSLTHNFGVPRLFLITLLVGAVLYVSLGGVKRIGKISGYLLPFFLCLYIFMAFFVIISEAHALPGLFVTIFKSAFSGHAALGGFAGSSVIFAIQHGLARAAYSADIGIGYDSIIQSESSVTRPEAQARFAIFGVFIDNVICTLSILVVLLSQVWLAETPVPGSQLVQVALSHYFPLMHIFMPLFLTILGFTTLTAFFCVGIKCARFLFPRRGTLIYVLYGTLSFILFAFIDQKNALVVMSISGAMLLIVNLIAMFRLRKEIFIKPSIEIASSQLVESDNK
jgi:AGCS family alanine or glycine:cation symporter